MEDDKVSFSKKIGGLDLCKLALISDQILSNVSNAGVDKSPKNKTLKFRDSAPGIISKYAYDYFSDSFLDKDKRTKLKND